ncbi:MAG: YbfB/YjiJ family MFS transporter [Proteobacteria bacterium]|nr:YbfB/YjiJ family MFS transporter [Pseudomonadota bacterium]
MTRNPVLLAFGGLLAMAAGIGMGRFVYTPILPPMVEALGLTKSAAGLVASANFLGYLLGALLAAVRLPGSRRAWLLGALAVNALCLAAMAAASTLLPFLALRLLAGMASAFCLIFASALVLDRLAAAGRGGLSALHFAGVGVGIAVSAATVALLRDWQAMWLAAAALATVAGLAVVAIVPPEAAPAAAATRATRSRPSGGFLVLAVAYFLFGLGYVITATFLIDIVRGTPAIRHFEPYAWVLVGLGAAPSVLLWTAIGRRIGLLQAFAVACVVEALGVLASVLWLTTAGVVLAALCLGGTFMGLTALGLVAAREAGDGDPRGRIALMTAAFGLGQIIGPVVAGVVYDATGSLVGPSVAAAAGLVIAAALALLAVRRPAA